MSNSLCPFCAWAACGLLLILCVPELARLATPVGPLGLWMLIVPFASAALRRGLRAVQA
jgi:hypothetical protein